jgi:hypothetical protein
MVTIVVEAAAGFQLLAFSFAAGSVLASRRTLAAWTPPVQPLWRAALLEARCSRTRAKVHRNKTWSWSSTDAHPSDKNLPMDGAQLYFPRVGEAGGQLKAESWKRWPLWQLFVEGSVAVAKKDNEGPNTDCGSEWEIQQAEEGGHDGHDTAPLAALIQTPCGYQRQAEADY